MALAGIGCALGAIGRSSWAGPGVALFALATFLVDFLVPALNWPNWVHQLALSAHVGQPMSGAWDGPGMATCLAIAVVGIVVAGVAMRRRDVNAWRLSSVYEARGSRPGTAAGSSTDSPDPTWASTTSSAGPMVVKAE
jgi:hypothetical protein